MPLETATFISDLVASNPPGTDLESQGANHLRLIKSVLQATFPVTGKAYNFPSSAAKSANYSVQKADQNVTFIATTSGGLFTFTLPTLVAGDAGWSCKFMKIGSDVNPFFINPPSGTLQSGEITGLAASRRCIPGRETLAFWTGSLWVLTRVPSVPIGTILDCWQAGLPVGYEWANGAGFGGNYPDLNVATGGTSPDLTGRCTFGLDNVGGVQTNRITSTVNWNGTVKGNAGGNQVISLGLSDLPNFAPSFTQAAYALASGAVGGFNNLPDASSAWSQQTTGSGGNKGAVTAGSVGNVPSLSVGTTINRTGDGAVGSINNNQAQTTPTNLSPGMSIPKIMVVE